MSLLLEVRKDRDVSHCAQGAKGPPSVSRGWFYLLSSISVTPDVFCAQIGTNFHEY
jgi:hypothetical protein